MKATDDLENSYLKGVYKNTVVPAGNYVQKAEAANATSFSPIEGVTLYLVNEGDEPTISPFRAYTRTVTGAGVATLYLDFDAVIPDEDFLLVCAVTQLDGTMAYLKEIKGGIIPANTGVMIFANPGDYTFYPSSVAPTENVSSLLHGVLTDTSIKTLREQEDGAYIFVLSRGIEEYTGFKPVGTTVKTIPAYRAYLPVSQTVEVKVIYVSYWGQVVTGIEDLKMTAEKNLNNVIYDLSGRRITNPTKGLYIINGKKVLMK